MFLGSVVRYHVTLISGVFRLQIYIVLLSNFGSLWDGFKLKQTLHGINQKENASLFIHSSAGDFQIRDCVISSIK